MQSEYYAGSLIENKALQLRAAERLEQELARVRKLASALSSKGMPISAEVDDALGDVETLLQAMTAAHPTRQ